MKVYFRKTALHAASGLTKITNRLKRMIDFDNDKKIDQITSINKITQIKLSLQYKDILYKKTALPYLYETEFRSFSQNGEDGILLYIFSLIGVTTRRCVEVCAEYGIECNTANLIINHGWTGLLFDGSKENIDFGKLFYIRNKLTMYALPSLISAWITKENINLLIKNNGFEGEIDLLSLDLDGMDYWIWDAITIINPRVVVLEYNSMLGPYNCVTVPYKADFNRYDIDPRYCSASLSAFVKLAKSKGYRLVGCQSLGFNAFFIRNGIGDSIFPEISVEDCFKRPYISNDDVINWNKYSSLVEKYLWVEV